MNPFNQFGKSFLTSRHPDNSQSVSNTNANPLPRNEGVNIPLPIQLLGLQNSRTSDPNNSQRTLPNYDSLNHPTKRVRHSQDNYSEVNREAQQLPNDLRSSGRLEDQVQARLAKKTADDEFISQNTGLRRSQGSLPLGLQDSSVFSSNPNLRDYANLMLTKQLLEKHQKGTMYRENAPNQMPFPAQNEALFSLLANNINLANLIPNAPNLNNALAFELLRQIEQQQAVQQLNQYFQLNQHLLQNLQDAGQINPHQKSPPTGSNSSMPRIPPLNPMTQFERMAASTGTPNGIGPLIRPELRDKAQASSFIKEGFKRPNSGQLSEKTDRDLKIEIPIPVKEERVEQPEINELETITTQDHLDEDSLSKNDTNRREEEKQAPFYGYKDIPTMQIVSKKAKIPQRDVLDQPVVPKKVRDARGKNRWQMMLEKQDKVDDDNPQNIMSSHKDRRSILSERVERGGPNALRPLKPRNYDKENQEGNIDNDDYEVSKPRSSVHKKKKKGSAYKNSHKQSALKDNGDDIYQDDMNQGMYSTSTNLNIPGENNNFMRISSSFGKTAEDYMLKEDEEQRIVDLHVGDEYQAKILELDLNANGSLEKRIPKVLWDPETFDDETLSAYYTKLQKILGCKGINEEKAIKMLIKKNMIPDEVIVTIKKNEKFYYNYLGNAQLEKDMKMKKGSIDIK